MEEIKEKVEKIIDKIKKDDNFAKTWKQNPVKAVEDVLGVDLPDDMINNIIDAVKTKLTVDNASDAINKVKDLFEKK